MPSAQFFVVVPAAHWIAFIELPAQPASKMAVAAIMIAGCIDHRLFPHTESVPIEGRLVVWHLP